MYIDILIHTHTYVYVYICLSDLAGDTEKFQDHSTVAVESKGTHINVLDWPIRHAVDQAHSYQAAIHLFSICGCPTLCYLDFLSLFCCCHFDRTVCKSLKK